MTDHDPESELLQSWRHEPISSPDFNAGVWARIESRRRRPEPVLFQRWALPLAASLALIAGAGMAMHQVDQQHSERMAASLVRSVDPLQMTAAHHHHEP